MSRRRSQFTQVPSPGEVSTAPTSYKLVTVQAGLARRLTETFDNFPHPDVREVIASLAINSSLLAHNNGARHNQDIKDEAFKLARRALAVSSGDLHLTAQAMKQVCDVPSVIETLRSGAGRIPGFTEEAITGKVVFNAWQFLDRQFADPRNHEGLVDLSIEEDLAQLIPEPSPDGFAGSGVSQQMGEGAEQTQQHDSEQEVFDVVVEAWNLGTEPIA